MTYVRKSFNIRTVDSSYDDNSNSDDNSNRNNNDNKHHNNNCNYRNKRATNRIDQLLNIRPTTIRPTYGLKNTFFVWNVSLISGIS